MKLRNVVFAAIIIIMGSCTSQKKSDSVVTKEITMASIDGWAEGIAMTYVSKNILEDLGYTVTIKKAAIDMVFASLAHNDVDVFMDVWLPDAHKSKVDRFGDKIQSLGINLDQARIGIVVPAYVNINSIEELNSVADKLDGKIFGIEKGTAMTAKTELAIKEYGLNYEQMNSSCIGMIAALTKAIKENRWAVVVGWAPHWKFGRYDLKFLEDPKNIYGNTEHIETYARKGFKEDDPFAAAYFSNFHLTDSEMNGLLNKMEDSSDDKDTIAKAWIAENQKLVQGWLTISE
jgi:glycine betaine/proline transport system substrate-binding protein